MFIDRGAKILRLRSEERKVSGVVRLNLKAAPPNGVAAEFCAPAYKHLTPTE